MLMLQAVTQPDEIYQLILRFDDVLPHLKEKVADYRTFSQKLSQFAKVRVAVEGDDICGFVVFYANDTQNHRGFVTLLACAREYQGCGVGRFLMEQACAEAAAEGMKVLRLEVDLDNTGAIAFYKKMGFTQTGERLTGSIYLEKTLPLLKT